MIDLSHRITSGMTVFPGDPDVHLAPALTVERDGVAVTKVDMGSHTGTHLDAPSHTVAGGRTLEGITLDELCGEALVIRVTGAREGQALDERDRAGERDVGQGDAKPDLLGIGGCDRQRVRHLPGLGLRREQGSLAPSNPDAVVSDLLGPTGDLRHCVGSTQRAGRWQDDSKTHYTVLSKGRPRRCGGRRRTGKRIVAVSNVVV
mgnify:CR=1 FL=1